MKNILTSFAIASLALVAVVARGGDFITGSEYQTGNGTNGMTRVIPSLATDGVAVQSTKPNISAAPIADYAKITLQSANGVAPFINPLATSFLRCWHYTASPSAPTTFAWNKCPYMDIVVDGGNLNGSTSALSTIEFPAMGPLPVEGPGNRYDWQAENVMTDSGTGLTVDGGVWVMIQLVTP